MVERPAAARGDFRVWRRLTTRWGDNDPYGHVNNVVFYAWFDSAVNAWLIEQGLLDIAHGDLIAVVAETACSFARSLAFPADVDVGIAAEPLERALSYRHFRDRGEAGSGERPFRACPG